MTKKSLNTSRNTHLEQSNTLNTNNARDADKNRSVKEQTRPWPKEQKLALVY